MPGIYKIFVSKGQKMKWIREIYHYFFCDHIFIADFSSAIRQKIPAIGGKLICDKCRKSFEYRFIIYK